MTSIKIYKTIGDRIVIRIQGHSGYDVIGKDIVCAGVSALYCTAVDVFEALQKGGKLSYTSEQRDGFRKLTVQPAEQCRSTVMFAIAIFAAGFRRIGAMYPDNVRVNMSDIPL